MKPVGYLLNTGEGLAGEPGLYFNYILAGNGLFVEASGPLLQATVYAAPAQVRGLQPLEEKLYLPHGPIPRLLYDLALFDLSGHPHEERFLAITWGKHLGEERYQLHTPPQVGGSLRLEYERPSNRVMDIHSHASLGAFFSSTDDRDEQGLGLYMVVGRLDAMQAEVQLRVGVYGYFHALEIKEVFA